MRSNTENHIITENLFKEMQKNLVRGVRRHCIVLALDSTAGLIKGRNNDSNNNAVLCSFITLFLFS